MKLYEVCSYVSDKIDNSELNNNNYISTENMKPNCGGITIASNVPIGKSIRFKEGDILFSNIRPYFKKLWRANTSGGCSGDVLCIRANENINPTYLYFLLIQDSYISYVMKGTKGCKMPRGDKQYNMAWDIELPSLNIQQKIAAQLSEIDDKIAVNRRICENLKAQAQALFKHWFIDFAPFKDGNFVESELGMIPEGWRVGSLDEYVENLSGYSYKGNELQPSTTAMATIKNFVRGGGFKIEGYKEIIISKNIKEYQYVNLFDVLVAHTDLTQNAEVVGNPAIILSTAGYEKLIMSMDLTKVVSKDARITPPLLHSILSTRKFKEHALGYVNGTTVLHMSKKAVPEYKLVMPKDLDELKELTSVLDNLYSLMSEIYAENLRLSTLRDTLLPKLMSGQIKV